MFAFLGPVYAGHVRFLFDFCSPRSVPERPVWHRTVDTGSTRGSTRNPAAAAVVSPSGLPPTGLGLLRAEQGRESCGRRFLPARQQVLVHTHGEGRVGMAEPLAHDFDGYVGGQHE